MSKETREISVGQKYGKLEVIKIYPIKTVCLCRCVCNKIVELPVSKLLYGRVKTCGCRSRRGNVLKAGDICSNYRLIKQTRRVYNSGQKKYWEIECVSCGYKKELRESQIVSKQIGLCPVCKK